MSKLGNTLRMLFILKSGQVIRGKDIAEKLEVKERQVRRYKETLEEFFDIESISGPAGGYRLREAYFPFKEVLSEEEVFLLKNTIDLLDSTILDSNEQLKRAIEKINYSILNTNEDIVTEQLIPYSKIKDDGFKQKKAIDEIFGAIFNRLEIEIEYIDNKGMSSSRRVEPYEFLRYKGERYLVANCLLRNELRFFKIARIKEYKITNCKFERNIDVKKIIEEYRCNSLGIFGGKEHNIVLEIIPPMSNTIKERIWVDNQEVEELECGKIIFKATMKGGPEIISWILSMGEAVRVIEPKELKTQLKETLKNMIKNME